MTWQYFLHHRPLVRGIHWSLVDIPPNMPVNMFILLLAWAMCSWSRIILLLWRHNGCNAVSNHQRLDSLFNRLFRFRSKKTSKLCVTGLCEGNSPGTCEFPAQRPLMRKMFLFDDVIMLCMRPANKRRRYNVTSSFIDWAHTQNNPRKGAMNILWWCWWNVYSTIHST